jgi:heme-degrading monooxygenase HmoA
MEAVFEEQYGPTGAWVELFRRSPDYVETLLLKNRSVPQRYVTVDRWRSEAAFRRFREEQDASYRTLDERSAVFTKQEVCLGEYSCRVV